LLEAVGKTVYKASKTIGCNTPKTQEINKLLQGANNLPGHVITFSTCLTTAIIAINTFNKIREEFNFDVHNFKSSEYSKNKSSFHESLENIKNFLDRISKSKIITEKNTSKFALYANDLKHKIQEIKNAIERKLAELNNSSGIFEGLASVASALSYFAVKFVIGKANAATVAANIAEAVYAIALGAIAVSAMIIFISAIEVFLIFDSFNNKKEENKEKCRKLIQSLEQIHESLSEIQKEFSGKDLEKGGINLNEKDKDSFSKLKTEI
ncbi:12316_t:CDS:2, partial [Acaulospora morrowiae]